MEKVRFSDTLSTERKELFNNEINAINALELHLTVLRGDEGFINSVKEVIEHLKDYVSNVEYITT